MAFMLGDIIVDRVQYAYGEKLNGDPCLLMSQLSDFTVDISAESKDAVDAQGTLVKRFWQAKTGEVTATNAMINFSSLAAQGGTDAEMASATKKIVMPRIATVKKGERLDITGYIDEYPDDPNRASIHVTAINSSGGMGQEYGLTEFNLVDGEGADAGKKFLVPPTTGDADRFMVKYSREVDSGARIVNESDKFPGTIVLTVKALAVDPCSVDTLKALYIRFPSFQISPELSLSLTTDTSVDFSGSLQSSYCGSEKILYEVFWADNDSED